MAARSRWIGSLPRLCAALRAAAGAGSMVATRLLEESWTWMTGTLDRQMLTTQPSSRRAALDALAAPIAAWLQATEAAGQPALRDNAIGVLCAYGDDLLSCLLRVIRTADLPGRDVLTTRCAERLAARLALAPRAEGDWSIPLPPGCACGLCNTLGEFLTDPDRRALEWPLAKQGRQHVQGGIDAHELPVRHQTRRTGRPYTLVLTKTSELFEREAQARRRDETDLAWLLGAL